MVKLRWPNRHACKVDNSSNLRPVLRNKYNFGECARASNVRTKSSLASTPARTFPWPELQPRTSCVCLANHASESYPSPPPFQQQPAASQHPAEHHNAHPQPQTQLQPQLSNSNPTSSLNPLEQLRTTTDPALRGELLRQLDGRWREWEATYVPSAAELCLQAELGLGRAEVMQAAVQHPGLSALHPASQLLPSLAALRAARLPPPALRRLAATRPQLLGRPQQLASWLDFLSEYGMQPHDLHHFLLRCSPALLSAPTSIYQAGCAISFLSRALGLSHHLLATRILAAWPDLLGCDVGGQLGPVVAFLQAEGGLCGPGEVAEVVGGWPEVLVRDVGRQLAPWVGWLRELGCGREQVAHVLRRHPHLLAFPPEQVFGGVLAALREGAGFTREDVRHMLQAGAGEEAAGAAGSGGGGGAEGIASSVAFLIRPAAAAGVGATLECLIRHGFSQEQVRHMCLRRPQLLAAPAPDLHRTLGFLYDEFNSLPAAAEGSAEYGSPGVGAEAALYGSPGPGAEAVRRAVEGCPLLLCWPLGERLGPRYSFVRQHGLVHRYLGGDGGGLQFSALLEPGDAEWCAGLGTSARTYQAFKLVWDEEYSLRVQGDAAEEL